MLANVATIVSAIISFMGSILDGPTVAAQKASLAAVLCIPMIGGIIALITRIVKRSR